ncbi:hypothetical protein [Neisseria shayeganii]|uniref:Uncharacterized protein n=1 Tax=Neisseria shayeganii TaxID=607712 RepID=A0A7D7T5U5_9NEIS|nr:hypothetical protein [Neisseria shayeganii]QMT41273.1 hypothetical protein H3L94_04395 [Neisseria shayeganii]
MFDFSRATARYQDKQLAAHIDQISRAQAAEWVQESRNEVLRAYYPQCRAIAAEQAYPFATCNGDFDLSDVEPCQWHEWLEVETPASLREAMLLLIAEDADFAGLDFLATEAAKKALQAA